MLGFISHVGGGMAFLTFLGTISTATLARSVSSANTNHPAGKIELELPDKEGAIKKKRKRRFTKGEQVLITLSKMFLLFPCCLCCCNRLKKLI